MAQVAHPLKAISPSIANSAAATLSCERICSGTCNRAPEEDRAARQIQTDGADPRSDRRLCKRQLAGSRANFCSQAAVTAQTFRGKVCRPQCRLWPVARQRNFTSASTLCSPIFPPRHTGTRAAPCLRRRRCCADRSGLDRPSAASSGQDRAPGIAPIP